VTRTATIVSVASHLPEREITNDELRARFPAGRETIDKLETGSTIVRRFWAPDSARTSDLAAAAGCEAIRRANLKPEDIDLVILGTDSPDHMTPSTSCVVQHKLGAKNAGTFDVGCACSSFATSLTIGSSWIATNADTKHVLVIGAYMMHRLADPNDPHIFFYGDGAGAVVLSATDAPGFVSSATRADGSYAPYWGIFSGGTAEPTTPESVAAGRTYVKMLQSYPPEVAHYEGWTWLARHVSERGKFSLDEVKLFLFTQVRRRSIEKVMDMLGQPVERAHMIMDKFGYTGSACLPMALDDAVAAGKLSRGDLVLFVGSGVGYNQAGAAFRWTM
jgi:3-oxoacyl-[acyl-carrier-protein] synthase-3